MAISSEIGRLGIMDPHQMGVLQQIFDAACARLDLDPKSPAAETIAQRLVAAYQAGTLERQSFLDSLTD